MSKDFMTLTKSVEILLFLAAGIIILYLGVWFLTDPASIAIFIIMVLIFTNNILIDNVLLSSIILTFGIVFVVVGIISLVIGIRVIVKSIKKKEVHGRRPSYMNLEWLREQHYEMGRSVKDIAKDQGVSIGTINRWLYKLDVKSAGLGEEE